MSTAKQSLVGLIIVCGLALVIALVAALAAVTPVARATGATAPAGTILYAKAGGLSSGACDTWLNACELRYALISSVSGQEVWVAEGTYTPMELGALDDWWPAGGNRCGLVSCRRRKRICCPAACRRDLPGSSFACNLGQNVPEKRQNAWLGHHLSFQEG